MFVGSDLIASSLKKPLLIVFLVLFADQAIKIWIKTNMYLGQEFGLLGEWFMIHFTENNGMAFGLEFAGDYGKLALSVFRILAVGGIAYYLTTLVKKKAPNGFVISIALILAGALGNILDSAFYGILFNDSTRQIASFLPADGGYAGFLHGRVVDMFHFSVTWPGWVPYLGNQQIFPPVFNLADSSITIGVAMIVIFQKRYFAIPIELEATENTPVSEAENPIESENPAPTDSRDTESSS